MADGMADGMAEGMAFEPVRQKPGHTALTSTRDSVAANDRTAAFCIALEMPYLENMPIAMPNSHANRLD